MMGHEIATAIRRRRDQRRPAALILPVGPMGMYRWAVYFLKEWDVACDHVYGFNMDEWSDRDGVTLPPEHPGAFQNAMEAAFYGPLGERDRARVAALVRHGRPPAALRRADRRAEGQGGRADRDLRHRPGLPHRLLGAALRRGIREPRRMEGPDASDRGAAAPADDRAERADQLQEPDDAGPRLRQHDRPGPVPRRPIGSSAAPTASSTAACSGRAPASG